MKNNIKCLIYSILTTISFSVYLKMYITNIYFLWLGIVFLFLAFLFLYRSFFKDVKLELKYSIFAFIMSLIITILYSYEVKSDASLIFSKLSYFLFSSLRVLGFYFFLKMIIYYIDKLFLKKFKIKSNIINKFAKKPFLYSFIVLFFVYSIYLLFYYPGIINPDNTNQIKEFMGLHTRYLDAIIPISNSTLTNFNPIIHTVLLGGFFKIGYLIGNVNIGLLFYTIFQMLIVITIYSYVINYTIKKKINPLYPFITLIILSIVPVFPFYSITLVKDTLYTSFLLLFVICVNEIISNKKINIHNYMDLFISGILVSLFRNNGILIVVITISILAFRNKKLLVPLIIILLFYGTFVKIIIPSFGVSPTSVREVLSIPFQQTARVVKYHEDSLSKEEKETIGKILRYKTLKKDYKENFADPVKNKFNKYATKKELRDYLLLWGRGIVKYPTIYVDALVNNISGYFNPFVNSWKVYHLWNEQMKKTDFDYHYNNLQVGRDILYNYELLIEVSPLGIILNIAFINWFSMYLFIKFINKKELFILIPNIISLFFCVLSPANTYFRYVYPSLVMLVCILPLLKNSVETD